MKRAWKNNIERYHIDMRYYATVKYYGIQKQIETKGLKPIDREKFLEWCEKNPQFKKTFKNWQKHRNARRYAPTIRRINKSKGYLFQNLKVV